MLRPFEYSELMLRDALLHTLVVKSGYLSNGYRPILPILLEMVMCKTPVDQHFLKYSGQPVWHQQPCSFA